MDPHNIMEEEETQVLQFREIKDDETDDLIPKFKIMSLRDGTHIKQQMSQNLQNIKNEDKEKFKQQQQEQNAVNAHYSKINNLLYELRKDYLYHLEHKVEEEETNQ